MTKKGGEVEKKEKKGGMKRKTIRRRNNKIEENKKWKTKQKCHNGRKNRVADIKITMADPQQRGRSKCETLARNLDFEFGFNCKYCKYIFFLNEKKWQR